MVYKGRAQSAGDSAELRFESSLLASHPEFAAGELEARIIAPGHLLVRTRGAAGAGRDLILSAFLAFLDERMAAEPALLRPLTDEDVAGLDELLDGVEYDKDADLEDAQATSSRTAPAMRAETAR